MEEAILGSADEAISIKPPKGEAMRGLCGEALKRTKHLDLVWRVSIAHSNSWYQITQRGYFEDRGDRKEAGPLMKEDEAIVLAGRLLEDALGRPWLRESAQRAIDKLKRAKKGFSKPIESKDR